MQRTASVPSVLFMIMLLCEFDSTLNGLFAFRRFIVSHLWTFTTGLLVDAVQNFTCALVGWCLLNSRDDIIVIKILRTE